MPGDRDDALALQMWHRMATAGELELLFPRRPAPGAFLAILRDAITTGWELDDEGVWFLAWLEPMFDGALVCCWIREDRRRSRAARDAIVAFHEQVFAAGVPVLLVVTKQAAVATTVGKLGYREVGTVGRLYGGETATILSLDAETWKHGLEQG